MSFVEKSTRLHPARRRRNRSTASTRFARSCAKVGTKCAITLPWRVMAMVSPCSTIRSSSEKRALASAALTSRMETIVLLTGLFVLEGLETNATNLCPSPSGYRPRIGVRGGLFAGMTLGEGLRSQRSRNARTCWSTWAVRLRSSSGSFSGPNMRLFRRSMTFWFSWVLAVFVS